MDRKTVEDYSASDLKTDKGCYPAVSGDPQHISKQPHGRRSSQYTEQSLLNRGPVIDFAYVTTDGNESSYFESSAHISRKYEELKISTDSESEIKRSQRSLVPQFSAEVESR